MLLQYDPDINLKTLNLNSKPNSYQKLTTFCWGLVHFLLEILLASEYIVATQPFSDTCHALKTLNFILLTY